MSASQQYASPTGADARHLISSNINPDSPTSPSSNDGHLASRQTGRKDAALTIPCRTAANLGYKQNVGYEFDASFRADAMKNYSGKDGFPRADHQSTSREAGTTQQAGSHGITNLPETFDERQNSARGRNNLEILIRNAESSSEASPLLLSGAQPQAVATSGTQIPHVETANVIEGFGSAGLKKRRRDQKPDLSPVNNTASSDDGSPVSKISKIDCKCDDVHAWWMTLEIGEMNEVLDRIDAAIGLVMNLSYGSKNMGHITAEYNLVDILKESREVLDSAKDDMRAEGGRDREARE